MAKQQRLIQIIVLSLLPFCFGQFSIQGPSDGNRRAQGLKYSSDKGVEYTDQAASLGTGGFSITGASDGNSDFVIQGASDGNSEFRIQGATDGNAQFQIQGPTDGGSQAYIQNYEQQQEPQQPVQPAQGRAIEYKDPNGHRVNWRSYNRAAEKPRVQEQQQYEEPAPRPVHRRPSHRRTQAQAAAAPRPQPQPAAAQQERRFQYGAPVANINYNPIDKAPPSIQEILQFQAQIPYVNIIPEQLRHDALEAAKAQAQKFAEEYPKQVLAQHPPQLVIEEAPRSQYRSKPRPQQQREQVRERRQAPAHQDVYYQERLQAFAKQQEEQRQLGYAQPGRRGTPSPDPYQQLFQEQAQAYQEQEYRPPQRAFKRVVQQPPPEPLPKYSGNVPSQIQEILRFQAQIPYDVIANQIVYRPEKPYIPQPVQPQPHSEAPQPVASQYKPQAADYQQPQYEQASADVYARKAHQQQLQEEQQGQLSYAQSRGLGYYGSQEQQREVTEPREQQY